MCEIDGREEDGKGENERGEKAEGGPEREEVVSSKEEHVSDQSITSRVAKTQLSLFRSLCCPR